MVKLNFRDKITLSGFAMLIVGAGLLIFTFASAYGFLTESLSILASTDLARTFGEALAPLISTCIRVMYLGIMGWIGSLLTIRGVTIFSQARQMPEPAAKEQLPVKEVAEKAKQEVKEEIKEEPKPEPKLEKVEKPQGEIKQPEQKQPEAKPYEPEIIVLTPENTPEARQEPQQPQQPQTEQK